MEILLMDVRHAARALLKSPGYTLVAIVALALGIGANAAIFGLIDAALLHPLPGIHGPERLIMIGRTVAKGRYASSREFDTLSYPNYLDLREQATHLQGVAGYSSTLTSVVASGEAQMLTAEMVSGNFFEVLGVGAARGRLLQPADENPSSPSVGVISFGLWQRLGANDDVIGSGITVAGRPVTVVGVAQRGFRGLDPTTVTELWVSLPMQPALMMGNFNYLTSPEPRRIAWLQIFGRMKPGVSFPAARAEVETIGERLATAYPKDNRDTGVTAIAGLGLDPRGREQITRLGVILLGAVGLVLLIACGNVANLMLARTSSRQREVAIRVALGASRARLMRQLLTESTLLAIVAGACGVLLSTWITDGLQWLSPGSSVPLPKEITLDLWVVTMTFSVSLLAGLIFGIAPAAQGFVRDLVPVLKESGAQTSGSRLRLRSTIIVAEISVSLVLLASAGLLMKTLLRFQQIDPGFRTRNLVMLSIFPALEGYDEARSRQLYEEIQRRLEAAPGVQAVTMARVRPLQPGGWGSSYEVQGLSSEHRSVQFNTVASNYFEVLGIDIVEGRGFSKTDSGGSPLVAVINQTMARTLWPNESAVGKHIKVGNDQQWREIVGVGRDVKTRTLTEDPKPYLYLSMSQPMPFWRTSAILEIKTDLPVVAVLSAVKNVVRAVDARLPLYAPRTLAQQFGYSYWQQRVAVCLIGAFAVLALLLAAVGVYGVIAYHVAERTRELGIRMALGAQRGDVLRLVMRSGVGLAAAGVLIGTVGGFAATRALKSLLFGVSASDPTSLLTTAGVLAAVALGASLVPANRATRVDPMVTLRHE